MNTTEFIVLIVVLAGGFTVLFSYLIKFKRENDAKDASLKSNENQTIVMMQEWMRQFRESSDQTKNEMNQTRRELQAGMEGNSKAINERLDNAAKVINMVNKELGQVQQIGQSFAQFQDFFLSAKKRGGVGEQIMGEMLHQSLPPHMFELQYHFRTGEIVDSIVHVGGRILAMDSKFSMENYRAYLNATTDELRDATRKAFIKDVKKRIEEISKKYILPAEHTFDFALMYVPADGVFNEITDDIEIFEYSRSKHVLIVSPSTFYYYLQILMVGFQRERINEQAESILKAIQSLRLDSEKFSGNLTLLTKHITNAKSTLDLVGTSYERIHNKIDEVATLKLNVIEADKIVEASIDNSDQKLI
jgi:DNA recombination protein RmuC